MFSERSNHYLENAWNTWEWRKRNLIDRWLFSTGPERERIFAITIELDRMQKEVGQIFADRRAEQRKYEFLLNNTLLYLSCPKIHRQDKSHLLKGKVVAFKDHIPGKYKCKACGGDLMSKDEASLEHELRPLRIRVTPK